MIHVISSGASVDIVVGSKIKMIDGYLPLQFKGDWLDVMAVDEGGPYVSLEAQMVQPDEELDINALSCVSPKIIQAVI